MGRALALRPPSPLPLPSQQLLLPPSQLLLLPLSQLPQRRCAMPPKEAHWPCGHRQLLLLREWGKHLV